MDIGNLGGLSPFMRQMITRKEGGGIEAPTNILKTVSSAYQQYVVVREGDIPRIATYAAIQGMLNGNPPFDQEELEANGLGGNANFNNFKATSLCDKSALGFWNLINSTEVFVKIKLALQNPDAKKYADLMARHFSDMCKEWEDFAPNFNLLGGQVTNFGFCPVIFPHEESPMWEVVEVSRFHIPSQSQVFMSKLSNVAVDTIYTVQELYMIYENISGEDSPWNKKALESFLLLRANSILPHGVLPYANLMDAVRAYSDDDALANRYYNDTVRLVNMYQKEYDNKISHYIFSTDIFQTSSLGVDPDLHDFLYFVDRQYKSIEDAVIVFTADPGQWTIHGNKGVGHKLFAPAQAINMLDCSIVDMARMSSTPLIRSLATGGKGTDPIRFYPGVATDIGAAEFVQNNLGANINQLVGASQYLSAGLQMNMVNAGDDPAVPDAAQGSISAGEARGRDFKEFSVLRNVVAHFYNTFDKVVRLTFVRFLTVKEGQPGYELAKEWKLRCIEDGVPEELFDTAKKGLHGLPRQFRSVKASRVAGDGSNYARIMGLEAMDRIVSTFNQRELNAWKRDWVEATAGVDYVDTYVTTDSGDELSGGASVARTEDNLMKLGQEPLFSADNDQAAHADEHMGTLTGIVQAVSQQQMSPVDADKIMAIGIPHITEHIQFMSKAPLFYREVLGKLEKPYKQLLQWAQLNRRNAEAMIAAAMKKQQEDAAATQQVMDENERKNFMAQKDVERADFKVTQQVERAKEANVTRGEVMKEKVRSDADTKRLKVQLDAEVKQNATAKGREQTELANSSPEELSLQLKGMTGLTPSTVDFE